MVALGTLVLVLVVTYFATRDLVSLSNSHCEHDPFGVPEVVVDWRLQGQLEVMEELVFVIESIGPIGDRNRVAIPMQTAMRNSGTLRLGMDSSFIGNCTMFVEKRKSGDRFGNRERASNVIRFGWTGA
jgi:hypothetical protein